MTTAYPKVLAHKPVGGFIFLTVQQLCLLWWTYRTKLIRLMDVRVWYAAQEMAARRCELNAGQVPDYTPQELHSLVGGVGGEHLRASIRRLEALGLLSWSTNILTFVTSPTDLRGVQNDADFATMLQAIPNHHRRVPVPRQTVRLIAGGCRATVIATILGHLIRCLYYRDHRCISGGWCKASWIAEVFHMDLRNIKAARKHLVTIGWLCLCDTPQAVCNHWGTYTLISLSWTRAALQPGGQTIATPPHTGSPPPPKFSTTKLSPLSKEHIQPLQELIHQNPKLPPEAAPTPRPITPTTDKSTTGVQKHTRQHEPTPIAYPPTLSNIVPEDLHDTSRLLTLFRQAQTLSLIGKRDSDRLTFVALAEHTKATGRVNPCGLFAALVHRRHWHFVTDRDEDAAQARLKSYLYGTATRATSSPEMEVPDLSQDATIVRYMRIQLAHAGWHGNPFALVCREDPTWTRERWDQAVAECERAQAIWQHTAACTRLNT